MSQQRQGYDPHEYWRGLLGRSFNLQGVGVVGRSVSFNRWAYRARVAVIDAAIGRVDGQRVLDVGSGTGFWVQHWLRRGAAQVAGVDLTPLSVENLRARFPDMRFEEADVSDAIPIPGPFDLLSAIDVLLHITDEVRYQAALANLRGAVRPGSRLVLIEPVTFGPPRPMLPGAHSRTRSLDDVRQALDGAGWRLTAVKPVTWLYANPVEIRPATVFNALRLTWKATSLAARSEAGGAIAGAVISPIDAALRRLRWGPSSKLLVAKAV